MFLVKNGHVMIDEPSKHFPDRIVGELQIDPDNMAKSTGFSIPLYRDGKSIWRQGLDTGGDNRDRGGAPLLVLPVQPFERLGNGCPHRRDDFACYSCAARSYSGRRLPVGQFYSIHSGCFVDLLRSVT